MFGRKKKKLTFFVITVGLVSPLSEIHANGNTTEDIKWLEQTEHVIAIPNMVDWFGVEQRFKKSPLPLKKAAIVCGETKFSPDEIKSIASATAQKYGVPEAILINLIDVESSFDRFRNSAKGAKGPMQLMPETAAYFGVNDICDSVQNIDGGTRFLKELLDKYKAVDVALAAYNAGEPAVDRYGGIPPYTETKEYVSKIVSRLPSSEIPTKKSNPVENLAGVVIGKSEKNFASGVMNFNGVQHDL